MGFELLARTYRATALAACLAALAAVLTFDVMTGVAILLGTAWSLANFRLLEMVVRALGPRGQEAPLRATVGFLLKGPLLYGAGWWLLAAGLSPPALLAGFALPFAVLTLRAAGALLFPGRKSIAEAAAALRKGARRGAGLAGAVLLLVSLAGAGAATAQEHGAAKAEEHGAAAAGEHGAATGHAAGEQAHAQHAEHPELPNFITFLRSMYEGRPQPAWLTFLHTWENVVFSLLAALILILLFGLSARPKKMVPGRLQNLGETVLGGLHDFFLGILGPEGKQYVPFVGSLFLYIVTMNWMGLLPFLKAPTSSLNTTLALALCTFVYVQYIGITKNGIGGYLYHFAGQPKDAIGWGSAILLFPIEVMGEFIRPVSLTFRLFGNILSEDILLAVLVGLGVTMLAALNSPIGVPLQIPFLFLFTLFGLIQALVFSLLSSIYIVMMLPHDEHGHHADHAGAQAAHH